MYNQRNYTGMEKEWSEKVKGEGNFESYGQKQHIFNLDWIRYLERSNISRQMASLNRKGHFVPAVDPKHWPKNPPNTTAMMYHESFLIYLAGIITFFASHLEQ